MYLPGAVHTTGSEYTVVQEVVTDVLELTEETRPPEKEEEERGTKICLVGDPVWEEMMTGLGAELMKTGAEEKRSWLEVGSEEGGEVWVPITNCCTVLLGVCWGASST